MRLAASAVVGLAAIVLLGPALLPAGREHLAVTGTPADYGLAFEPVRLTPSDRPIGLRGWWMPARDARAAVVLVHGGGEDNRTQPYQNGMALARDLVAKKLSVLTFDMRNFGESDTTPEGRTFGDLEAYDVLSAVAAIGDRLPGVPVVAIGCSMGGATVIQAAARGAALGAVVVDSAYTDARDVAVPFTMAATGWPRLAVLPFVWSAEHVHGLPLARGATLAAAHRVPPTIPVLVVENAGDPIVSVDDARALAAALPRAETWITPAPPPTHPLVWQQGPFGMHCQSYKLDPAGYVERVTRFFDAALGIP